MTSLKLYLDTRKNNKEDKYSLSMKVSHFLAFQLNKIYPGLTPYWARHSWAILASEIDVPNDVISRALGQGSFSGAKVTKGMQ